MWDYIKKEQLQEFSWPRAKKEKVKETINGYIEKYSSHKSIKQYKQLNKLLAQFGCKCVDVTKDGKETKKGNAEDGLCIIKRI